MVWKDGAGSAPALDPEAPTAAVGPQTAGAAAPGPALPLLPLVLPEEASPLRKDPPILSSYTFDWQLSVASPLLTVLQSGRTLEIKVS